MADFAHAQDQWYSTWPQSEDDRALRMCVHTLLAHRRSPSNTCLQRLRQDVGVMLVSGHILYRLVSGLSARCTHLYLVDWVGTFAHCTLVDGYRMGGRCYLRRVDGRC